MRDDVNYFADIRYQVMNARRPGKERGAYPETSRIY